MPTTSESVLLLFAFTHGHTGKVAARLADRIRESGTSVHVVDIAEAEALDPSPYAVVDDAGITPTISAAFGGALQYREYPLPTRVLMRLVARHRGLPTDPSVDVDYTDWDAVDTFADAVGALVPRAVAA